MELATCKNYASSLGVTCPPTFFFGPPHAFSEQVLDEYFCVRKIVQRFRHVYLHFLAIYLPQSISVKLRGKIDPLLVVHSRSHVASVFFFFTCVLIERTFLFSVFTTGHCRYHWLVNSSSHNKRLSSSRHISLSEKPYMHSMYS